MANPQGITDTWRVAVGSSRAEKNAAWHATSFLFPCHAGRSDDSRLWHSLTVIKFFPSLWNLFQRLGKIALCACKAKRHPPPKHTACSYGSHSHRGDTLSDFFPQKRHAKPDGCASIRCCFAAKRDGVIPQNGIPATPKVNGGDTLRAVF